MKTNHKILLTIFILVLLNILTLAGVFVYVEHKISQQNKYISNKIQKEISKIKTKSDNNKPSKNNTRNPFDILEKDSFFEDRFQMPEPSMEMPDLKDFPTDREGFRGYNKQSGLLNINGEQLYYELESQNGKVSGKIKTKNQEVLDKLQEKLKKNGLEVERQENAVIFKGKDTSMKDIQNNIFNPNNNKEDGYF